MLKVIDSNVKTSYVIMRQNLYVTNENEDLFFMSNIVFMNNILYSLLKVLMMQYILIKHMEIDTLYFTLC